MVKIIVTKNYFIGLIGKTAEPDSNKSSGVMNQWTNAQMEWTIHLQPDFIGFKTRILSLRQIMWFVGQSLQQIQAESDMETVEEIPTELSLGIT